MPPTIPCTIKNADAVLAACEGESLDLALLTEKNWTATARIAQMIHIALHQEANAKGITDKTGRTPAQVALSQFDPSMLCLLMRHALLSMNQRMLVVHNCHADGLTITEAASTQAPVTEPPPVQLSDETTNGIIAQINPTKEGTKNNDESGS